MLYNTIYEDIDKTGQIPNPDKDFQEIQNIVIKEKLNQHIFENNK